MEGDSELGNGSVELLEENRVEASGSQIRALSALQNLRTAEIMAWKREMVCRSQAWDNSCWDQKPKG